MLGQQQPQIGKFRCCCNCVFKNKSRLPKRLFLTLQSLITMIVIMIRNTRAYPMHAATTSLSFAPPQKVETRTISLISWHSSSLLIRKPDTRSSLQRLYWKPNTFPAETYRWQQQRQNVVSSSSSPTVPTIASQISTSTTSAGIPMTQLQVLSNIRDADIVEMLIGGERYSLVPMPKAMKATTIFVGNICEFVQDSDLSAYFSQVSSLTSVPSCVVRKVNTQSMGYGFVSFPNVEEKEVIHICVADKEIRAKFRIFVLSYS